MLNKAVEEIKIIQDDVQSSIVIDDETFQEVVENKGIANGTISTDELTDDEVLDLLEDPVANLEAYKEIMDKEVSE
jgi:hypothetical protein|nr:MAG TPA: hypothetical protein [Caudoviricetes sp.]